MLSETGELVRRVVVDPLPEGGLEVELAADAAERQALRRRLDLLELEALRAHGHIQRHGKELRLIGELEAVVAQTCVVSLDPVRSRLTEPFERRWLLPGAGPAPETDELVDPEAVDVEPLEGAVIDFGAVVAEELALALDPYPRLEDAYARLPELGPDVSLGEGEITDGRFTVLEQLEVKRRR
jgi:uncharacterized metal-binding protein YceD (DUF177 family)